MPKIISIHSFRRGTGKSVLTANFAALLAAQGQRVVVIDTNLESPSLHILFGLKENEFSYTLNQFLWKQCSIRQTLHDVTTRMGGSLPGQIFLIPASTEFEDTKRLLREGYDTGLLNYGCYELVEKLDIDFLLIDTHAGLYAETLASIAIAHTLAIILRLDRQDYQGTSVLIDLTRQIDIPPRRILIANEVPLPFDFTRVKAELEKTYQCEVAAILPHAEELMTLESPHIFALLYPGHPLTLTLSAAVTSLTA